MISGPFFGDRLIIGWSEWCTLPGLGLPAIKAKIDTGAKTSSLHAFDIQPFVRKKRDYVSFKIHPIQGNNQVSIACISEISDQRNVMSSNGHIEHRYVIRTPVRLGDKKWDIELTLSNRDPLKFRMLLGREALVHYVIIDPARVMCQGKVTKRKLSRLYGSY